MAAELATSMQIDRDVAPAGDGPSGPPATAGTPEQTRAPVGPWRGLVVAWGAGGVAAFLLFAVVRLSPIALEPLAGELSWSIVAAYALSIASLGYSEGYRAFQLRYSPRVVARARHLAAGPLRPAMLLAPIFCMGLFGATRRLWIVSWSVLIGVAGLVVIVKALPQPWRGAVDAGVVVGLSWGVLTIAWWWIQARRGRSIPVPPGVPDPPVVR